MAAKVTAARFIDVALCKTGQLSLSYLDKKLKWYIREDVLSLISEFPTLKLTISPFPNNDGATVHLLTATGILSLPSSDVHVTIWVLQSYPFLSPLVYLLNPCGGKPISHPCIDLSTGFTTTPYLTTWNHRKSNLSDLVRNLVRILIFRPPSDGPDAVIRYSSNSWSSPSRREAVDRLSLHLLDDLSILRSEVNNETVKLTSILSILNERSRSSSSVLVELEKEKITLEKKVKEIKKGNEELSRWLEVHDVKEDEDDILAFFEEEDEKSRVLVEEMAVEEAIDDTMKKMETAMGRGLVPFDLYLKQVRVLAKEQFYHTAIYVNYLEVSKEARSTISDS